MRIINNVCAAGSRTLERLVRAWLWKRGLGVVLREPDDIPLIWKHGGPVIPLGYRILGKGDTLQHGDLFMCVNKWCPTHCRATLEGLPGELTFIRPNASGNQTARQGRSG